MRALVANAAEVEHDPVRLIGLGDGVDGLAVGVGAFGEFLAAALDIAEREDRLGVLRMLGDDVIEPLLGLVGAIELIEIAGELDLGVARQRRRRRHALVDLDREVGFLQRLVEVGERQQRHGVRRLEIKRELQIDQRQILAAAAADRGAEPVERLGGAGLR